MTVPIFVVATVTTISHSTYTFTVKGTDTGTAVHGRMHKKHVTEGRKETKGSIDVTCSNSHDNSGWAGVLFAYFSQVITYSTDASILLWEDIASTPSQAARNGLNTMEPHYTYISRHGGRNLYFLTIF